MYFSAVKIIVLMQTNILFNLTHYAVNAVAGLGLATPL